MDVGGFQRRDWRSNKEAGKRTKKQPARKEGKRRPQGANPPAQEGGNLQGMTARKDTSTGKNQYNILVRS